MLKTFKYKLFPVLTLDLKKAISQFLNNIYTNCPKKRDYKISSHMLISLKISQTLLKMLYTFITVINKLKSMKFSYKVQK